MATLKSTQFAAIEAGRVSTYQLPKQGLDGRSLHYEFSFPATVAAGDNMILGYLDDNIPLPELGRIASDGGATALTVSLGHGEYNVSTGVLTVTDDDSFCASYVADAADATDMLHDDAPTAGVFTRVEGTNDRIDKTVVIATAVAETLGEDATVIADLPCAINPTS
jgi:hypothetical protein